VDVLDVRGVGELARVYVLNAGVDEVARVDVLSVGVDEVERVDVLDARAPDEAARVDVLDVRGSMNLQEWMYSMRELWF
jgi:hypothetical protein